MFETENFYKLDAIKWNHYVETMDESLITNDLLNIEHEDAIEYIVTEIPEKKFEVNTTPHELACLCKQNSGYNAAIDKYGSVMINSINCYPSMDEIKNMPFEPTYEVDETIMMLRKYFELFKSFFLVPLYLAGMDYLGHTIYHAYEIRMLKLPEIYEVVARHGRVYEDYGDTEILYKNYHDFYNFIYNKVFVTDKVYPNDSCPCGSGLKYKKCCMKNSKFLYQKMTEDQIIY